MVNQQELNLVTMVGLSSFLPLKHLSYAKQHDICYLAKVNKYCIGAKHIPGISVA